MSKAQFSSLLSRIAEVSRYPDEASSTLGRLLAQECMVQKDVFEANGRILDEVLAKFSQGCEGVASAYFHWMANLYVSKINETQGSEQSSLVLEQVRNHAYGYAKYKNNVNTFVSYKSFLFEGFVSLEGVTYNVPVIQFQWG